MNRQSIVADIENLRKWMPMRGLGNLKGYGVCLIYVRTRRKTTNGAHQYQIFEIDINGPRMLLSEYSLQVRALSAILVDTYNTVVA